MNSTSERHNVIVKDVEAIIHLGKAAKKDIKATADQRLRFEKAFLKHTGYSLRSTSVSLKIINNGMRDILHVYIGDKEVMTADCVKIATCNQSNKPGRATYFSWKWFKDFPVQSLDMNSMLKYKKLYIEPALFPYLYHLASAYYDCVIDVGIDW